MLVEPLLLECHSLKFCLRAIGCVLKDPTGAGLNVHRVIVHVPIKRALLVILRHLVGLDDAGSPRGLHDVAGVAHLMLVMIALIDN